MAWSGGTYTKGNSATGGWAGDFALGVTIEAGRHDTQDNDFATGINQCVNKDGSNAMTGALNMNSNEVRSASKVGIGTASPAENLHVVGNQRFSQAVGSTIASFIASGTNSNLDLAAGATAYGSNGASMRLQSSGAGNDGVVAFSTNLSGTGAAERMRINNLGYIGVGNATPAVLVDAARNANDTLTRIRLHNASAGSSAQAQIDLGNDQSASAAGLILNSSTNTGNAGTNSLLLYHGLAATIRVRAFSGGVDLASGATSWAAVSDIRLKKNVKPLTYGLSKINQLDPVRFDYIEDESEDSKRIGFIAQQVQPVVPEAVTGTQDTYFGVSATELIPVMINAIKELSAKVTALEQQLEPVTSL